jgi:hypothetical protein
MTKGWRSGGTQARYWWASGSCCCRPLVGISPVPLSVPQPVSCVPLYHPGRRDFPGPVGSEDMSSWSLPASARGSSDGAHMPRVTRFAPRLVRSVFPGSPGTESQPFVPDRTAFAQGPFAPQALPCFHATTGPCADPRASPLPFGNRLMGEVLAACAIHGWSRGPSRFESALLSCSATSSTPAVVECT